MPLSRALTAGPGDIFRPAELTEFGAIFKTLGGGATATTPYTCEVN